jgi:hypothetical protein
MITIASLERRVGRYEVVLRAIWTLSGARRLVRGSRNGIVPLLVFL